MQYFPLRELGYAIGFIALMAALYVGAYYTTVERQLVSPGKGIDGERITGIGPKYRWGCDVLAPVFRPMHRLDERLRPEVWEDVDWIVDRLVEQVWESEK